jgi:hypothetical protein
MSAKGRVHHLRQKLPILAAILLGTVVVGFTAEVWVRLFSGNLASLRVESPSLRATFSLALTSLQAGLPVIAALVAVPLLGARLLFQLYDVEDLKEAHDFLNRLTFGRLGLRPMVLAEEGKLAFGEDTVAARVGGPASLIVYNDTAAVTEQGGRLKRVLGPGVHTLEPYEKIWETVDLRPQRRVRQVSALTKEGIPISCNVDICFRIADLPPGTGAKRESSGRQGRMPYAYSEDAVLRAVTSKWICGPGDENVALNWDARVMSMAEDALRDILATYRLDWLVKAPQPEQLHPRDEIRRWLKAELDETVTTAGVQLMEIEPGQIQVKAPEREDAQTEDVSERLLEIVSQRWIEAWNADWSARALTSRAEGEAELLRIDAARIQAQAEMVIALTESLQPMLTRQEASEPYVLALRVVEALRWMSYDPGMREFMPPEAMRTVKRLQELLDSEATSPGQNRRADRWGEQV